MSRVRYVGYVALFLFQLYSRSPSKLFRVQKKYEVMAYIAHTAHKLPGKPTKPGSVDAAIAVTAASPSANLTPFRFGENSLDFLAE